MAERQAAVEFSSRQLSDSLKQLHATRAQLLLADRLAAIGQLAAGVGLSSILASSLPPAPCPLS
jgi:hypothetical protein